MNQDQFQSQPQFGQSPDPLLPGQDKGNPLKRYGLIGLAGLLFIVAIVVAVLAFQDSKPANNSAVKDDAPAQTEDLDTEAASTAKVALVELKSDGPNPDSLTVTPGTSVEWQNKDSKAHVLSGDVIGGDNTVEKDASFTYVFDQPGDYTIKDGTREITVMVKE